MDSIVALRFCTLAWIPSSNIALCRDIVLKIINLKQAGTKVCFKWVPSHEGIPQNELADRLAGAAGQKVDANEPLKNQPPLSCGVSSCIAKAAIKEQLQERWLRISMARQDMDHLSHVQLGLNVVSRFFVGTRYTQTTLARFRFGHSELNAHLFRVGRTESPICECGRGEEDNYHFFMDCAMYESPRHTLLLKVSNMLPINTHISLNLLLGGPDFKHTNDVYERVAKELVVFVEKTQRLH